MRTAARHYRSSCLVAPPSQVRGSAKGFDDVADDVFTERLARKRLDASGGGGGSRFHWLKVLSPAKGFALDTAIDRGASAWPQRSVVRPLTCALLRQGSLSPTSPVGSQE